MPRITVNGAELAYDDAGAGPPLVLVHAGIADRRMWRHQVGPLAAAGHRVVAYDLRGYGGSSLPAGPFAHHDDLSGLLDALAIDRTTVCGCSLGAAVAVDFALAAADRCAGLVLAGPGLSGHPWSAQFRAAWLDQVGGADPDDLAAVAAAEVRFWVVGPGRAPEAVDAGLRAFAVEMDLAALAAEAALEAATERELEPPAAGRLAEVRAPALVVVGADDVPEIGVIADRLVAGIPDARRVDIADAGHLVPLERPAEFTGAVLAFLAGRRGERSRP